MKVCLHIFSPQPLTHHFLSLETVPLKQDLDGIGLWYRFRRCCANKMALWQNLLPQVLCSLRSPREHGTSLFPIFNAPNRTSKKMLYIVAKKSIIQRYYWKDCSLLHLCIHQTGSAVTVPEFTGAFPLVWAAILISLFSTLTPASPTY